MKWPTELLLVRHAESAYNILKHAKDADPDYQRFVHLFDTDRFNPETKALAGLLHKRHALGCSDRDTPITPRGEQQARLTGQGMRDAGVQVPEIIFVSPFLRTERTLEIFLQEWPALQNAKIYRDERIRERDNGLSLVYNDWRIYKVNHPEQAALYDLVGYYDYRYLNGENIPDVRMRNLSWIATVTREFASKRVMAITHHLNILATRANFERLSPAQFAHLDEHEKPVNCGVTTYVGNPAKGSGGKLELRDYNRQYYPSDL
jgi:broad specificity phosphatase PhoE